MEEIWKVWKETNGHKYGHIIWEVSNYGNVKKNGVPYECKLYGGYKSFGGRCYTHRAVAILFIPNPENKPCVDHINGNPLDNRACNLRWVTPKENSNNPITLKRMGESHRGKRQYGYNKGENNPMYGKPGANRGRRRVYHGDGTWHMEKNL